MGRRVHFPKKSVSRTGFRLPKELLAHDRMEGGRNCFRTKCYQSFSAVKNQDSYLILTQEGTILLFENGEKIYCGSSSSFDGSHWEQVVYVRAGDFYLLRFKNLIFKKRIDDKEPFLLVEAELDQTESCSFRHLKSDPNRLLMKANNDQLILFNAKTSKVEARFKMAKGLYSVADFHSHNKVKAKPEEASGEVNTQETPSPASTSPLVTILCLTGKIRTYDMWRREILKTSNHTCRGLVQDQKIDLRSSTASAFTLSPDNKYICINLVVESGFATNSYLAVLESERGHDFTPFKVLKTKNREGFSRMSCFGGFPGPRKFYLFALGASSFEGSFVKKRWRGQVLSVYELNLETEKLHLRYDLDITSVDESIFDFYKANQWFYYICDEGNFWRAKVPYYLDCELGGSWMGKRRPSGGEAVKRSIHLFSLQQ